MFDLRRCRRRLIPSSVTSDSRRHSRLLEDIDQSGADNETALDKAPTDSGPLIVVKHFCKVYVIFDCAR